MVSGYLQADVSDRMAIVTLWKATSDDMIDTTKDVFKLQLDTKFKD